MSTTTATVSSTNDPEQGELKPLLNNKDNNQIRSKVTIIADAVDTVRLGVPIFIAMLSWVGVSFQYM